MHNFKKVIMSMGLACSIAFISIPSFSYANIANTVYEQKNESYIAKGIKHEQHLKFTNSGWVNINVIRVNLDEPYATLDLLFHQNGLGQKAKVSEFVNQRSDVVGAVNGDFFNMKGAATIGPMVRDGELLTTTAYLGQAVPSMSFTNEKIPTIQNWVNNAIVLTNVTKGYNFEVLAANKESDYAHISVIYTPKWGVQTPAKNLAGGIQMVIQNNIVTEILPGGTAKVIPPNGSVIFAAGMKATELQQNFAVGDMVNFTNQANMDISNLKFAVGGGGLLVKDGIPQSNYYINIKGNQPRTALGISQDKKEAFIVTIDGRVGSYTGVTQEELAQIMISLGAYDAINLDGGGSTDMVLRPLGEENKKVINNLSEGVERRVMNGVGVVSNAPRTDEIGGMMLQIEDSNVPLNSSKKIQVKGYDANYYPLSIDVNKINWQVKGVEGKVTNGIFYAQSPGDGAIVAEIEGKTATLPIHVIDQITRLDIFPGKIQLGNNQKTNLTAKITDKDGYGSSINIKDLNVEIPNNLGTLDEMGYFHAGNQSGSGVMKLSYKNLVKYIPVVVGSKEVVIDDFENMNGQFLSYPSEVLGGYILSNISKNGQSSGELSYDFTKTDATRAAYLQFNNGGKYFTDKPQKIGMWVYGNHSGHSLKAKMFTANGTEQNITLANSIDWDGWKYVEGNIPESIGNKSRLERVYVVETNKLSKDAGKIYIDDLTVSYPNTFTGTIPQSENQEQNPKNIKAELKGQNSFKLLAHGAILGMNPEDIIKTAQTSNEKAEVNLFTQQIDPRLKEQLKNSTFVVGGGYSSTKYKNSLLISLDNTKGGLRETNFEQWRWFLNTVNQADSKNIIITLPKPLSFKDPLEEKLFNDTLNKFKKEKNAEVWVLTGGHDLFSVYPKEGIYYAELKSYSENRDIDKWEGFTYLMFTVNDDGITYEILPLNEKN
ncbi:phosphodiester glycosidase family protein [Inediibacterium massiliense]|uniref:phosphodiester glycosidase family protein n=1 Tax=Inediibacterium massiliense TaxID=1658111 RepID=UPI0006B64456|nr:phosphodiester glycosidase family protein [Inediibacterium massiliense]